MKHFTTLACCLALTITALPVRAHEGSHATHGKAAPQTIAGEVVDTGCYLAHSARGEKHIGCATKCINQGMPMGLLTGEGKLYLLTLNHDNPDPYNKLKGMAGKNVAVTGMVIERSGMKGIDVTEVKPFATKAGK